MSSIEQIPAAMTWHLRQEAMYPNMSLEEVKLPADEEGVHFGLFDQNRLISVISTFRDGKVMQFRKFATLTAYQHQGYGTKLWLHAIDYAKAEGMHTIWCNARSTLVKYYARFGFVATDEKFSKDGYDFVIMINKLIN